MHSQTVEFSDLCQWQCVLPQIEAKHLSSRSSPLELLTSAYSLTSALDPTWRRCCKPSKTLLVLPVMLSSVLMPNANKTILFVILP